MRRAQRLSRVDFPNVGATIPVVLSFLEARRMTRVAATYVMVFAAAAGPWLCCCSTTRAVAAVASLLGTEPSPDTATRCCGQPCAPTDRKDAPDSGRCPCKAFSFEVAGLPPGQTGSSVLLGDEFGFRDLTATFHSPERGAGDASLIESRSRGGGSLRERLSVLQTLRC